MFQGCQNWSWIGQGYLVQILSHYLENQMGGQSRAVDGDKASQATMQRDTLFFLKKEIQREKKCS
jgi:hypothetical protein